MRPAITWLITDTHLFHYRLTELSDRPPNFTELILKNWRLLVQPRDEVIHLGDVILYKETELAALMASLPGRKTLIMGNHDRKSRGWYMRNGFVFAADAIILDDVLLNHRPVESLPAGVRICVHGHLHNAQHPEYASIPAFNRLLALEHTDYKPVQLREFAR